MLDVLGMVAALERPKMLVQTARFGFDDYRRDFHLPRILNVATPPRCGEALIKLLELEADVNDMRKASHAEYSLTGHIDILIAIMGEAALLRASKRRQMDAPSGGEEVPDA